MKSDHLKNYFYLLCAILAAKALLIIWVILNAGIGLGPDEAQYWTWSQQLAPGYYSKPPGIAWQIWFGTQLFGNTELGVRFGSVLLGFLLPIAVYFIAKGCRLNLQIAFWSAIIFAFSPLGFMSSFLAITDVGMVLFWALAFAVIVKALSDEQPLPFYLIGLLIFLGALFKWPIYNLWIFIAGLLLFRRDLYRHAFWGGILISLLGLVPSIIWNWSHDWATFRHVSATIEGKHEAGVGTTALMKGNFWEFVGSQAILLSPIFFVFLLLAFWSLLRNRRLNDFSLSFLGLVTFLIIAGYACFAFFKKVQGNWCDFAYPGAAVLAAWFAIEKAGKKWLYAGLVLSVAMLGVTLLIPYVQSRNIVQEYPLSYKINPFRHNVGWDRLNTILTDAGYDPHKDFLFADRYQTTSILSFYGPAQKRAYFFNLQGIRKNQFSYWPGMMDERKDQTGYFVLTENYPQLEEQAGIIKEAYQKKLEAYFDKVIFLGIHPLYFSYGKEVKAAFVFKGLGYNGKQPSDSQLY